MTKMEELIAASKIGEILQKQREGEKKKNTLICIFAVMEIGRAHV